MTNQNVSTDFTSSNHTALSFLQETAGTYTTTRPISGQEIISAAKYLLARQFKRDVFITNPEVCKDYFRLQLSEYEREVFCVMFLDSRHGLLAMEELFQGTINQGMVHAREVMKRALYHNASAVMFIHNHPSGDCRPSAADRRLTKHLQEVLAMVEVRVLDHIVIGGGSYFSFVEAGWIKSDN